MLTAENTVAGFESKQKITDANQSAEIETEKVKLKGLSDRMLIVESKVDALMSTPM